MKINIILLAAGNSKRFKENKLLTLYRGQALYKYIVEKVIDINVNKIICVTQYNEIKEELMKSEINVVSNYNSEVGISTSIKLGINFDKNADGYMFMVCDQPLILVETLKKLIDTFIKSNKGIVCVGYGNTKGNPVIFSKKYINELLSLQGDCGGKKVIKEHLDDLEIVNVYNENELFDIDTQEEFEKLTQFKCLQKRV